MIIRRFSPKNRSSISVTFFLRFCQNQKIKNISLQSLSRKYRREVTELGMGCLLQLIKTETDSECLQSTMEAIGSLVCADDDDFAEGTILRKSRFLERIRIEHIEMKNSLNS